MINKKHLVLIAFLSSYSAAENKHAAESIIIDIDGNGKNESVELELTRNKEFPYKLIISEDGKIISYAEKAFPNIKNNYSPNSYDGFIFDKITTEKDIIKNIDSQKESHRLILKGEQPTSYLTLITREEDNANYNFNIYFSYNKSENKILATRLLLNINNSSCDRSLISTYDLYNKSIIGQELNKFNGMDAFHELKKNYIISTNSSNSKKLINEDVLHYFKAALSAYKLSKEDIFKERISLLLDYNEDETNCNPESYILEKLYFPERVQLSNDIGFLLEEAGYLKEAKILLEKIVDEHPNRTVTYLNLADCDWLLKNKDSAISSYQKYSSLMKKEGKENKIPSRVLDRITNIN